MRLLRSARAGIAVACASTLAAATLVPAASSAASGAARAEAAGMQSITIKIAKKTITIKGAKGLDAGRVKIEVKGRGVAEILMLDPGYEYREFSKDVNASFRGDMKALRRAIAKTDFVGGVEAGGSGTVVLPKAGDYTVFSFGQRGPGPHATFRADASNRSAPAPDVDGKIIGRTGPKWGGSNDLPAKGTFLFKNADRTVPHFVELQQVVEGTTTDQVLETFMSEESGPPEWALPGHLITSSLSSGRAMTVNYDLPPGQYVVMCFFPDPNMKGMPHALMGMLKMVTLS